MPQHGQQWPQWQWDTCSWSMHMAGDGGACSCSRAGYSSNSSNSTATWLWGWGAGAFSAAAAMRADFAVVLAHQAAGVRGDGTQRRVGAHLVIRIEKPCGNHANRLGLAFESEGRIHRGWHAWMDGSRHGEGAPPVVVVRRRSPSRLVVAASAWKATKRGSGASSSQITAACRGRTRIRLDTLLRRVASDYSQVQVNNFKF